ncbi:MAG TPA: Na+/H+ antiporter NhaC family protein [Pseudomonadales bacterium]|nr:Na+/H+ antiporter NhaC family protein [Pseudomonadales bacterium]
MTDAAAHYGILSLLPALIAIVLAFVTRNTVLSLAVACLVGVLTMGEGALGLPNLLKRALGTESFAWILLLELFIGVVIAFFQRTGAIRNFTTFVENRALSRVKVQMIAWGMGLFVFFSDYFSPLFVGATLRDLSDRWHISREKLAYIADSTSAPVSVLVPITGWAVYIAGLLIGIGPVVTLEDAMGVFVRSVPYNAYALLAVAMVALIALKVIPDFGPMRRAEERAMNEGKVLRDGAEPLMSVELTGIVPYEGVRTHLGLNFVLPVLIVISIGLGSWIFGGSALTMEAFMAAAVVSGLIMRAQGIPLSAIMDAANQGMKGVLPAIIILAFAYALNRLSQDLGTALYILEATRAWLTPAMLPALVFLIAGSIAFSTGTSWGTFAIMMPIAAPLAFAFLDGQAGPLVYATVAAVAGGGVFGDHCSPLSDTSILASTGAASDHIDHVRTQLPYAACVGVVALLAYLLLGALL